MLFFFSVFQQLNGNPFKVKVSLQTKLWRYHVYASFTMNNRTICKNLSMYKMTDYNHGGKPLEYIRFSPML